MKLYTRTGDDGTTGLFGGQRVAKDHPRVEAYGTVDELNAVLGIAAATCADGSAVETRVRAILHEAQSRLFDIGADLATPEGDRHESKIRRMDANDIEEIEGWIDEIDAGNDPMTHFVLPGGTRLASSLHHARTVCRRAERSMIRANHVEPVTTAAIVYVNRLSDLLFAMSRLANKDAGVADVPWIPNARSAPG